jgi:hypothetical protein
MSRTIGTAISEALRSAAKAYALGDQVPPCAVLWPDPEQLWAPVIPELGKAIHELFVLGPYAPTEHRGPAL